MTSLLTWTSSSTLFYFWVSTSTHKGSAIVRYDKIMEQQSGANEDAGQDEPSEEGRGSAYSEDFYLYSFKVIKAALHPNSLKSEQCERSKGQQGDHVNQNECVCWDHACPGWCGCCPDTLVCCLGGTYLLAGCTPGFICSHPRLAVLSCGACRLSHAQQPMPTIGVSVVLGPLHVRCHVNLAFHPCSLEG